MRTTVNLSPDVAAEVARLRAQSGLSLSEAVNTLARRGIGSPSPRRRFVQRTAPMGATVDVSNIGDVLDLLDQDATG